MTRSDGASLAMAGLWSTWHDPEADKDAPPLVTCAVLTTDAIGELADIHDRMPLLLAPADWANVAGPGPRRRGRPAGPPPSRWSTRWNCGRCRTR